MHRGAFVLEKSYGVSFGKQQVGKVLVYQQGLYYHFCCRCRLSGQVMYRLAVSCGEKQENLGVLVPMGDGFGLETKLPVKRLGQGELEFQLVSQYEQRQDRFVPISPEEPFAYISRLKTAYLARKNGRIGIMLEL